MPPVSPDTSTPSLRHYQLMVYRVALGLLLLTPCRSEDPGAGAGSLAQLLSQLHHDPPRHASLEQTTERIAQVPVVPVQIDDGGIGRNTNEPGLEKKHDSVATEEDEEETHHGSWMKSGFYQGDIVGVEPSESVNDGRQYNAIRNRNLRWEDGIVPYVLATTYTQREKEIILRAMEKYHEETCIKFVPRSREHDYLFIVKSYGCYSQVGKVRGRQELSLGNGCLYHEIAVHELMHALGFWHEHSRADRDQFINIQWHNIIGGMRGQFDKISTAYQDFLGETYDYKSVMHYDSRAFSRNGLNTIETTQPGFTKVIGKAKDLSEIDIRKVNKLYQCPQLKTGGSGGRKLPVATFTPPTTTTPQPTQPEPNGRGIQPPSVIGSDSECVDKFLDCPFFHRYCFRRSFFFIMKLYCPKTCGHCVSTGNTISSFNSVLGSSSIGFQTEEKRAEEQRTEPKGFFSGLSSFLG